jgi:hypothetical protein
MMGMGLTSENDSSLRTDAAKLFYCAEMLSYDALGVPGSCGGKGGT